MTRMFKTITQTWNPFVGCLFECSYCWARRLAETRLKDSLHYRDGFKPTFIKQRLNRRFKPGDFVFISDMGDIAWADREWVAMILRRIVQFPQSDFLFQSKKPRQYLDWHLDFPSNVYLGTTIETNRDYDLSKSPQPLERYLALALIQHPRKFVSIEPIMDFDLDELVGWISRIRPEIVEVGADNYRNNLSEPSWKKVKALLHKLRQICPRVEEKDGLSRLKERW